MTVLQAGKNLSAQLSAFYDNREAEKIADMIIEKITALTKTQRIINKERSLTDDQEQQLQQLTTQLLQSKPIQYVLHEAWFCGMSFYVDENVLIPRPETEELVKSVSEASINKKYSVLDVGTGSGCIGISLKKKFPLLNVNGLDISINALHIAKKNAEQNDVFVNFFQTDILDTDSTIRLPVYDIIVSNPPYIQQSEASEILPNVLLHEPHNALFVPDNNPLIFYKAIANFGLQHLDKNHGKLFFEINEMMGQPILNLLTEKGFSEINVLKDLHGKDRIVSAVLRKDETK